MSRNLSLEQAASCIAAGELVAYPTEAVWGLGCDPLNQLALIRLLQLKQRDVEKGLILVAANWQQLERFIEPLSVSQQQQLSGPSRPTTFLLPFKKYSLPPQVVGRFDTVAVRISEHPVVRALCLLNKGPIISTSANPAGCLPAREIFQIKRYFGKDFPICRGQIGHESRPSIIQDLMTGQVLRH